VTYCAVKTSGSPEHLRRLIAKQIILAYGADEYRAEDSLEPLRNRDDFRLVMMDLAMPPDAFAAAR
jgi:hypothetical protein